MEPSPRSCFTGPGPAPQICSRSTDTALPLLSLSTGTTAAGLSNSNSMPPFLSSPSSWDIFKADQITHEYIRQSRSRCQKIIHSVPLYLEPRMRVSGMANSIQSHVAYDAKNEMVDQYPRPRPRPPHMPPPRTLALPRPGNGGGPPVIAAGPRGMPNEAETSAASSSLHGIVTYRHIEPFPWERPVAPKDLSERLEQWEASALTPKIGRAMVRKEAREATKRGTCFAQVADFGKRAGLAGALSPRVPVLKDLPVAVARGA